MSCGFFSFYRCGFYEKMKFIRYAFQPLNLTLERRANRLTEIWYCRAGKKKSFFFFGRAQTGESQLGIQKQVKKKVMQYRDDALQNNNNRVTVKRKSLQLFHSGGHHSKLNLPEGFTWDVLPDTTLAFIQNWDWHKGVTTQFSYWVLFWKYAPFLLGTQSVSQMSLLVLLLLSFLSLNVGSCRPGILQLRVSSCDIPAATQHLHQREAFSEVQPSTG